jgi:hypothetical protein
MPQILAQIIQGSGLGKSRTLILFNFELKILRIKLDCEKSARTVIRYDLL